MSYFMRKNEDIVVTEVESAHGGTGTLLVSQILGFQEGADFPGDKEDFSSAVNFFHRLVLKPGASIGMHLHDKTEEFYYIEKGEGVMVTENEEIFMPPHSTFMIKPCSSHALYNRTDSDLVVLVLEISL